MDKITRIGFTSTENCNNMINILDVLQTEKYIIVRKIFQRFNSQFSKLFLTLNLEKIRIL